MARSGGEAEGLYDVGWESIGKAYEGREGPLVMVKCGGMVGEGLGCKMVRRRWSQVGF